MDLVHGDLCLSNMLLNVERKSLIVDLEMPRLGGRLADLEQLTSSILDTWCDLISSVVSNIDLA